MRKIYPSFIQAGRIHNPNRKGIYAVFLGLTLLLTGLHSRAQVIYSEVFDTGIPAGWTIQNNSNPIGTASWFQGFTAADNAFDAHSGAPNSYVAAYFEAVETAGTISDWLFMPTITLKNGDIFTFYTRAFNGAFPDRLQVRMSINGTSTDVGSTENSTGDFSNLLLDINPTYTATGYPEVWTEYQVSIAGLSAPVSGRLAFRYFVEDGGSFGSRSNYVGVDDVSYSTFPDCTGTPDPGTTVSSASTICPSVNFTLSMSNTDYEGSISYQWQSSSTSSGTYTDITGANSPTLVTTQNSSTFYRCNVTCVATGNSASSTALQVTLDNTDQCYCIPPASICSDNDEILNVTIGAFSNSSSGCTGNGYTNYASTVAPAQLIAGGPNLIEVLVGPGGQDFVEAWIDYNHNTIFEPSEFTELTVNPVSGENVTAYINVPASAQSGLTRMRIRVSFGTSVSPIDACGIAPQNFGETEDYAVNIGPCVQGSFVDQPVNASIECGGNATFSATTSGTFINYQWEQRINSTAPWTLVTDGTVFTGSATATLSMTNVPDSYNGYQYRVLIQGSCTAPDFSAIGQLEVTPVVARVSPASAVVCIGAVQALSLSNAAALTRFTFNNNAITSIPDANSNGITSTISVSGIPSNLTIANISVTFNITHTWVGDLSINLVAPNGNSLNLIGRLNNTAGDNGTVNFTNTTISSTAVNPISGAASPRTGVYAADMLSGYGPSGNAQNVPDWNGLISVLNGDWRLAIADFAAFDIGTLNSWSVSITLGEPTVGTWSPLTGLFTDPAATIPYTGNPLTTVYANPLVSTSYSVIYSSLSCTSAPTVIPVTVTTPINGPLTISDQEGCAGGSATFTTDAQSTGPLTYQWQVSTNGSAFTDVIANGNGASLVLTGLTPDMHLNAYRVIVTAEPCGSVTSESATLRVNNAGQFTISSPLLSVTPGSTTTLTASNIPVPQSPASYTWTLNGDPITGATGSEITGIGVDGIGVYHATVIDENGCSNTSNDLVITAAISERLWIYPNPSYNGEFQVRLFAEGSPYQKRTVTIYNALGIQITQKSFFIDNTTNPYLRMDFNLGKMPSGVYVVKVSNNYTGKVVSGLVVTGR